MDRELCKACGHFMSGYVVALCSRLLVISCRGMWLPYVQDFWSFYVGVRGCFMFKASGHFMEFFYVQGICVFYVQGVRSFYAV